MTRTPRAFALGLLGAGLMAGGIALSSAPALGFTVHPYLSQITEANGKALGRPWGVSLDSSGNLFVSGEYEDSLVDVFDSSDTFTSAIGPAGDGRGLGIDQATSDVYVANSGRSKVDVLKPEGAGKYNLIQERAFPNLSGDFTYVAFDNSSGPHGGDAYVIYGPSTIYVMKPNAAGELEEPSEELAAPPEGFSLLGGHVEGSVGGLAIDEASGELYIANPKHGFVDEYSSGNVYLGRLSGPSGFEPVAVAVEESSGNVYAVDAAHNVVDEFDAAGKFVGRITETPAGPLSAPMGVAVSASGHVFVTDRNVGAVDVFGPGVLAPEASTGSVSNVVRTSAKLEGTVNPEGEEVSSCQFEYGTSIAYGHVAPCVPAPGSGPSPVPVSAEVSGLEPATSYYYRLVATGPKGTDQGAGESFPTVAAVPALQTEAASNVEQPAVGTINATLNGSLEPRGVDTHYYFEYGETKAYGTVSPALPGSDAGAASKVEHAQTSLSGLLPATLYHFRLVASNSYGTTVGADMTFVTPQREYAAPVLGDVPASSVAQFTATLNGTIETGEALVDYRFEYGTSTAYGSVAPSSDAYAPITSETVSVSQPVSNLQAGTTYHYRLVANSAGGTGVVGPDETFTTLPVPAPSVSTGGPSAVGVGEATINGSVDPHGVDTSYAFQYGTSTAYGSSWPTVLVEMGALEGPQPVEVTVPNLLPNTTYHYRLVASSGGGTSYGPDMTFTTSEYPPQVIQEPPILGTLFVPTGKVATPAVKTLTKAQKLKKALKACKKDKSKSKRAKCEKQAHKSYGPVKKAKKK